MPHATLSLSQTYPAHIHSFISHRAGSASALTSSPPSSYTSFICAHLSENNTIIPHTRFSRRHKPTNISHSTRVTPSRWLPSHTSSLRCRPSRKSLQNRRSLSTFLKLYRNHLHPPQQSALYPKIQQPRLPNAKASGVPMKMQLSSIFEGVA